ncbi:hypothetical protein NA78x_001475 [Anatilimnocola sp. NA78]|uniref:hypothetical protein n=1 Tax=Anatilimnocola sp. NA78 TaxID=3415683 RepID=UPI003CE59079
MRHFRLLSLRYWQATAAARGLLLLPLAGLMAPAHSMAQEQVYRSVADLRERMPDNHHLPRYNEKWTHRGVEIITNQISVIAKTNKVEDARSASEAATQAWKEAGDLADQFTMVHRHQEFGIGALQVVIDDQPLRDRDQPNTALNVVGQKSQVVIYVNPAEPSLERQMTRLKEASVLAFLRTTELDVQYPNWVTEGIAGYVAQQGATAETLAQAAPKPTTANIGGQQWRSIRAQQDVLQQPANEHADAVERVKFLLEGDDSSHAPAFFAMLRASAQDVANRRAGEKLVKPGQGQVQPSFASDFGDRLFASLENEFVNWQKEPLAGQPIYRPAKNTPAELQFLQREMMLVLKLMRRQATPTKSSVQTKVVMFKKDPTVPKADKSQLALELADPKRAFEEMLDGNQEPWATRDIDGSLLLSSNLPRLTQLFGDDGRRFQRVRQDDRWVLMVKLDQGRTMTAWLEESDETPLRPEARFEIQAPIKAAPYSPEKAKPAEPQAELGTPVPLQSAAKPTTTKLAPPGNQPIGQWRTKSIQPHQ